MIDKIEFVAVRVITFVFFTGLTGAVLVVIASWISVGKAAF